jgi:hypothetical protein
MSEQEELLRKWQLKKIATLAFINDECDDMKPKDRKAFYNMMEAIFGEMVSDLKNVALPSVSKCEDVERGDAVCVAPDDEGCFCKEIDMGCLECKYFRYKQTDC